MATTRRKLKSGMKGLSVINLLLEHGAIHAFLTSIPSTMLLDLPIGHLAAPNLTIWMHIPDEEMRKAMADRWKLKHGKRNKASDMIAAQLGEVHPQDLEAMLRRDKMTMLKSVVMQFHGAWHDAMDMRVRADKVGRKAQVWHTRAGKLAADLACFEAEYGNDVRILHIQGIERQKEHIRSLARQLQDMQRDHYIQESDKQVEKDELIADYATNGHGNAILQSTTVFSSLKPGHEEWVPVVQSHVHEFLAAGLKLQEMRTQEPVMRSRLKIAKLKHTGAALRFVKLGNAYDNLRVKCHKKMSLLEQYYHSIGWLKDNFVTQAKESLAEMRTVYGENLEKGYPWARDQVMRKRFGLGLEEAKAKLAEVAVAQQKEMEEVVAAAQQKDMEEELEAAEAKVKAAEVAAAEEKEMNEVLDAAEAPDAGERLVSPKEEDEKGRGKGKEKME
ncbi:MAG: hypothetical protein L6R40_007756 [Gallowayella cf. fulva]|nr:MAG: hypothetical protein L6R40_007756 [Xanthomendoza cf. fulva]